jgi:hypothetical protein
MIVATVTFSPNCSAVAPSVEATAPPALRVVASAAGLPAECPSLSTRLRREPLDGGGDVFCCGGRVVGVRKKWHR